LVLVTSRRRLVGLDQTRAVSLDVLPLRDAITLFTAAAGEGRTTGAPDAVLAEVAEACGRLPLALRIAAARLRSRPAWSVADLVGRLRDHGQRLAELEAGSRSVAAALEASYRDLPPPLQRAYRLLSLHPGGRPGPLRRGRPPRLLPRRRRPAARAPHRRPPAAGALAGPVRLPRPGPGARAGGVGAGGRRGGAPGGAHAALRPLPARGRGGHGRRLPARAQPPPGRPPGRRARPRVRRCGGRERLARARAAQPRRRRAPRRRARPAAARRAPRRHA